MHPSFRTCSEPTGDTFRGSEVTDVGGINQEDVLAKQGEKHARVRDPLEINLSMFLVYRALSFFSNVKYNNYNTYLETCSKFW